MKQALLLICIMLLAVSTGSHSAQKANLDSVYRLMNSHQYQPAINKLESIVHDYPEDADAWYQYSLALLRNRQFEASKKASLKLADFDGYQKFASFQLGLAYAHQDKPLQALKEVKKAFRLGYLNFDRLQTEPALEALRQQGEFTFSPPQEYKSFTAHNRVKVPYKTLLPRNFDAQKTYKAMLAFPPGSYGEASANWLIETLFDNDKNSDWIIAVVLAPKDGMLNHPSHHAINDLMKHLRKTYNIADNRFHFLGYQSGGDPAATYSQMSRDYVNGITVINSYNWDNWRDKDLISFRDTPMQLLVGELDRLALSVNQHVYDIIKRHNRNIHLQVFDGESVRLSSLENGKLFEYLK